MDISDFPFPWNSFNGIHIKKFHRMIFNSWLPFQWIRKKNRQLLYRAIWYDKPTKCVILTTNGHCSGIAIYKPVTIDFFLRFSYYINGSHDHEAADCNVSLCIKYNRDSRLTVMPASQNHQFTGTVSSSHLNPSRFDAQLRITLRGVLLSINIFGNWVNLSLL